MNHLLGFLPFLILGTVVGCQQGDKQTYANVKGTATFNGKPIEKGQINFALEGRPPSTMDIVDGEFAGQALVGSNKVSISARKKTATPAKLAKDAAHAQTQIKGYLEKKKGQPGGPTTTDYDASMVEYIPPEWGTRSTQMRVVEAGAANDFEFNIKAKN